MNSNSDLGFHTPGAALGGVDTAGAANNGMFSRLHAVGNPDWMASFSSSQQVAAARPVLAPPAPVASTLPRQLAAPAAIDAPAPAAKGFFSMFYRAPSSVATTTAAAAPSMEVSRAAGAAAAGSATSGYMPAPPKALDAFDFPPQRAMPVDAQLSLEHVSRSGVVEASMPAVRREPPRPMALGSDTWNALSSVPLPPKTSSTGPHVLSPPVAIDGFATRAPKPLWSDLSFTSRFRSSAPTLDAFRNVALPAPIASSPAEVHLQQPLLATSAAPVPPKPVTTSPLRDSAGSLDAVATYHTQPQRREGTARPLVPVGEEATPVTPLLKPVPESTPVQSFAKVEATRREAAAATTPAPIFSVAAENEVEVHHHRNGAVSPVLADFVKSIAEPATQKEQKEEALAAANVRNFLSTIFSRTEDAETSPAAKTDAFNALELAINRGTAQPRPTQPLSYSTFASSPLFVDNNDEDSDEGLERLRRVVSIVMQSAKSHDGTNSQPSSQTQRRNGGGAAASSPVPGKYTEFSTTYHATSNNTENDWMQYARF